MPMPPNHRQPLLNEKKTCKGPPEHALLAVRHDLAAYMPSWGAFSLPRLKASVATWRPPFFSNLSPSPLSAAAPGVAVQHGPPAAPFRCPSFGRQSWSYRAAADPLPLLPAVPPAQRLRPANGSLLERGPRCPFRIPSLIQVEHPRAPRFEPRGRRPAGAPNGSLYPPSEGLLLRRTRSRPARPLMPRLQNSHAFEPALAPYRRPHNSQST